MLTDLFSVSVKNIRSIKNISCLIYFRHRTCDQINMVFSGILRHRLPGWAAFFFCINRKVFSLVRTTEHLRENYKVRVICFYFFYISACGADILHFIFYCGHLDCCYFHVYPVLSLDNNIVFLSIITSKKYTDNPISKFKISPTHEHFSHVWGIFVFCIN